MEEKNEGQRIILCKKCGSNMIKKPIHLPYLIILWMLMPIILFIPWVNLAYATFICWLTGEYLIKNLLIRKIVMLECIQCKYSFGVDKEKYIEFKNYLR